jgi:ABC-2 family transporter protein
MSKFTNNESKYICYFFGFGFSFEPVIHSLEIMQEQHSIKSFSIVSKNLEGIFNEANQASTEVYTNGVEINITPDDVLRNGSDQKKPSPMLIDMELSTMDVIWSLLWKRFVHFKRNFRLLLTILVLPTIFVIIAMGFMKLRPPGEYDNELLLSKMLYKNSTEFYGYGNDPNAIEFKFEKSVYERLVSECGSNCKQFNDTGEVFHWLLDTHDDYLMNRYGGVTFNEDKNIVWYNNKGYHSIAAYLNYLNSALFKSEMNDSSRNIITYNHPLKLSSEELSYSSM